MTKGKNEREIENEKDLITNIAEAEFKNKRIRTFLSETELETALKNLYRSAKVSMEENGSNTLGHSNSGTYGNKSV